MTQSVICKGCSKGKCETCDRPDNCLCALVRHGMAKEPK